MKKKQTFQGILALFLLGIFIISISDLNSTEFKISITDINDDEIKIDLSFNFPEKIGDLVNSPDIAADENQLYYSTLIGSSGGDIAADIEIDQNGFIYIAGGTSSPYFPTTNGASDVIYGGVDDGFVCKLSPDGEEIIYSTFIGGDSIDQIADISVDSTGCVYVTGYTQSSDFPITSGALNTTYNGGNEDGFVCKLSSDGSTLEYCTYIGGSSDDKSTSITIDDSGNVFITGQTDSADFPITMGAYNDTLTGSMDNTFVCKVNSDGTDLLYSTFIGEADDTIGSHLEIDGEGYAYVSGKTYNTNFPTTIGAFDQSYNGGGDGYLCKINLDGSDLVYATFLGGSMTENIKSMCIDHLGNIYLAGYTNSVDFPTIMGAFDETFNENSDGFLCKINSDGSDLLYSSYLGGSGSDYAYAISLDYEDNVWVTGYTSSSNFPTTIDAYDQYLNNGTQDVFLSKFNISENNCQYSTFLGGSGIDMALGLAFNNNGQPYITGRSSSSDFPTTSKSLMMFETGTTNCFITALNLMPELAPFASFHANHTDIFVNQTIEFNFTGIRGSHNTKFIWNFGDDSINMSGESVIHKYRETGSFIVTLRIIEFTGEIDTATMVVNVYDLEVLEDGETESIFPYILDGSIIAGIAVVVMILVKQKKS